MAKSRSARTVSSDYRVILDIGCQVWIRTLETMMIGTNSYEVGWRRERLLAGARPRKTGMTIRQRAGLRLVQIGLAIAGRVTVNTVVGPGSPGSVGDPAAV
jgi:hypothetical protein